MRGVQSVLSLCGGIYFHTVFSFPLCHLQPMDHPSASSHPDGDDYLSSLPTECLHLILQYLEGDNRMFLLRNLVLVSKQFFRLVAPILYESPLELISSTQEEPHQSTPRLACLLGTLLGSIAHKRFVMDALPPLSQSFARFRLSNRDILALGLSTLFSNNNNNNSVSNSNSINNNNDTRDLDPDVQYAVDALDTMGAIQLTIDYLQFYINHRHLTIPDAFPTVFPSLDCHSVDEWLNSEDRQRIMDVFDRAFVLHCPEVVVSCCIPIPRVGPYLEAVSRMRRLKKVRLYNLQGKLSVQDAIRFVRLHDNFSLGLLASSSSDPMATSTPSSSSSSSTTSTSKSVSHFAPLTAINLGGGRGTRDFVCKDESLGDILGAMRQLCEVDTCFLTFRANFLEKLPPTSGLRVLRLGPTADVVGLTAPELAQTLWRFPLEELQIYLEDYRRHLFYYPIQEKKKNKDETIQDRGASHANQGLKRLFIGGNLRTTVRATQEALTAHSETITSLQVDCFELFQYDILDEVSLLANDPDLEPGSLPLPPLETNTPWAPLEPRHTQEQNDYKAYQSVNLCWTTTLPCLVRLEILGLAAIVGLHSMALRTCPNLKVLRLHATANHRTVLARCHVESILDSLLYARGQRPHGHGCQERGQVQGQGARLQELDLNGRWFISDRAFALLGSPCFPQLRSLSLQELETVDEDRYDIIRSLCRNDLEVKSLSLSKFMRQIPRCDAARLIEAQIESTALAREHDPASGDITGTGAALTVNGLLAGLRGMERLTEKCIEIDTIFMTEPHLERLKADAAYREEYDRLVEWALSRDGGWLSKEVITKRYNHTTVWEVIDQACRVDSYDTPPWSW